MTQSPNEAPSAAAPAFPHWRAAVVTQVLIRLYAAVVTQVLIRGQANDFIRRINIKKKQILLFCVTVTFEIFKRNEREREGQSKKSEREK